MAKLQRWLPRILTIGAASGATIAASFLASNDSSVAQLRFLSLFPPWADGPISSVVAGQRGFMRSSRAVYTFAVNSFDYKYSLQDLEKKSEEYYTVRSQIHLRAANRILKLCEANRGFYIKAGQFVASLQHIPKEYSTTLSVLQDQARSRPFQAIERVIVGEFGKNVQDIFAKFDEQPIAAASLAQVHHAVLKSGQDVAVKVQYPGLQQQFEIDISTMGFLSKAVARLFPDYQFEWIVPEFEESLSSELDFLQEGKNAEQTAKNFVNKNTVKVPEIHWDLSSGRVLTMEFVHGCKIDDVQCLKEAGIDPLQVAELLVEVFAEMIFCHGYVHGDPHPGNIFVNRHDHGIGRRNFDIGFQPHQESYHRTFVVYTYCNVLLDHGLYRKLDEGFRSEFCRLWKALILLDSNELEQVGDRLGAGKYSRYLPVILTGRPLNSKSGLGEGMTNEERDQLREEVKLFSMGDISLFMEKLPRDFLTVFRTDGLLRGITSKLGAEPRSRLIANAKYALMGLLHPGNPGLKTQGWQGYTRALCDYANLRFRLEVFEISYRFSKFYGTLLHKVRLLMNNTLGKLWKSASAA